MVVSRLAVSVDLQTHFLSWLWQTVLLLLKEPSVFLSVGSTNTRHCFRISSQAQEKLSLQNAVIQIHKLHRKETNDNPYNFLSMAWTYSSFSPLQDKAAQVALAGRQFSQRWARAEERGLTPMPRKARAGDQDTLTVLLMGQLSWRCSMCWCYPSLKR